MLAFSSVLGRASRSASLWQLLRSFPHSFVTRLHGRPSLSHHLFPKTFSLGLIFRRDWTPRLASLSWWLSDSQWFIVPLRRRTSRRILGVRSYKFFPVSHGSPAINRQAQIKNNIIKGKISSFRRSNTRKQKFLKTLLNSKNPCKIAKIVVINFLD